MRISKINLYGFKSFPDRTVISLGNGVSCVVGPNGCGKSNVLDAIKWCIGEQSAKSLRGSEMLDVIFAGSTERPPVGFAEVSITLQAEGGEPFPGEYVELLELEIGRRLHRSGASEYFINRTKCRRKDILNLFMDTGVGSSLYSFIEQGRVDSIVNAAPLDRRALIDEAAGISGYKARRAESLQRLQATGVQLDRAADVADEMGRRLRVVRQQVRRAAYFRRFRGLVRQREIALALIKYGALTADRRALREGAQGKERALARLQASDAKQAEELEASENELQTVSGALGEWREQLGELDGRLRELHATVGFVHQQQEKNGHLMKELSDESQSLSEEQKRIEDRNRESKKALDEGVALQRQLEEAYNGHQAEHQQLQLQRRDAQAAYDAAEGSVREIEKTLAALVAVYEQGLEQQQALPERRKEIVKQLDELAEEELRLGVSLADAQSRLLAARQAEPELKRTAAAALERQSSNRALVEQLVQKTKAADDAHRLFQEESERKSSALLHSIETRLLEIEEKISAEEKVGLEEIEALTRASQQLLLERRQTHEEHVLRERDEMERALNALSDRYDHEQQQLDEEWLAQIKAKEEEATRKLEEASSAENVRVAEAEAAFRSHYEATRIAAGRERAALQEQLQGAEARRLALIETREAINQEISEVLGRKGAVQESVNALLPVMVEGHPSLLDLGRWTSQDEWKTRAIGDRLVIPRFDSVDSVLLAMVGTSEQAGLRGLLELHDAEQQLLGGLVEVESREEALRCFQETGRGAVVRGTGERIDSDGAFRFGRAEDSGVVAMRLTKELQELSEAHLALRARLDENSGQIEACENEVERDRQRLEGVDNTISVAAETFREELVRTLEGMRAAQSEHIHQLSERVDQELRRLRDQRELELQAKRREHEHDLRQKREQREGELRARSSKFTLTIAEAEKQRELELSAARAQLTERIAEIRNASQEAQRQEQEALGSLRARAQREFDRIEAQRTSLQSALNEARSTLAESETFAVDALRAVSVQALLVERLTQEVQLLERRVVENKAVRNQRLHEAAKLESNGDDILQQQASKIEVVELDRSARVEKRNSAKRVLLEAVELVEAKGVALQGLLTRQSELQSEMAAAHERLRGIEAQHWAAVGRSEKLANDIDKAEGEKRRLVEEESRLEAEIQTVGKARGAMWDRSERERIRVEQLKEKLAGQREEGAALRQQLDELRNTIAEEQERIQAVQIDIEVIRRRISERYQISLAAQLDQMDVHGSYAISGGEAARKSVVIGREEIPAVDDLILSVSDLESVPFVEELLAELDEFRESLDKLGQVNLAAFEEFEELSKRHGELEAQRADLEDSVQSIRSAIAKMNRMCRLRFREAFDAVNEHFQEAYPALVGGGSANLSLTNEEDLLETGVDIFVQPPGKRPQNLNLLSGGEKAMAAIALLLALFKVKPSPFCVLDEVDAPLDEANGARFNHMLREMSRVSQFLVITHNRKTMECADTLYGITMPNPGVSKLVSVELGSP